MRDLHAAIGIFVFAVVLVIFVQLWNLPGPLPEDVRIKRERDELVVGYLYLKSGLMDQSMIENFLDRKLSQADEKPHLSDLLVLLLGVEGRLDKAMGVFEKLPDLPQKQILGYCFGLSDVIPLNWEDVYPEGWVKAKLASLIYTRDKDDALFADSLVSIREYENITQAFAHINDGIQLLGLLGFVFLTGMIFSKRYYRLLGKPFFLLNPLYIPTSNFFRFSGLLLIGFLLTGSLAQLIFGSVTTIGAMVCGYLMFILLTVFLARRIFFERGQSKLLQTLHLDNLKMQPSFVWQIFKTVAILISLLLASLALSQIFYWPLDRNALNYNYQALLQQPASAAILFVMGCILAPIFEEIIFRGMIQRALLGFGKPWVAILGSAAIFMIIHPMAQWPTTFAIGLGLGLIYQRTGHLLISIWAHAAWNGLVLLLLNFGILL